MSTSNKEENKTVLPESKNPKILNFFQNKNFLRIALASLMLVLVISAGIIGYYGFNNNQTENKQALADGICAAPGYVAANSVSTQPLNGPSGNFIYATNNTCVRTSGSIPIPPGVQVQWTDLQGRLRYFPATYTYPTGAGCPSGFTSKVNVNGPGTGALGQTGLSVNNTQACISLSTASCPYYGWIGTGNQCNVLYNMGANGCTFPFTNKSQFNFGGNGTSFPQTGTIAGQTIPDSNICFYPTSNQCPVGGLTWVGTGGNCNRAINFTPTCTTGTTWNGSNCVSLTCPNGASNPPQCNQFPPCPINQYRDVSSCVPCPAGTNSPAGSTSSSQCVSSIVNSGNITSASCNPTTILQGASTNCVAFLNSSNLIGNITFSSTAGFCIATLVPNSNTASCTIATTNSTPTGTFPVSAQASGGGSPVSSGNLTVNPNSTIINQGNIGQASDCTTDDRIVTGQTYACTFLLTGSNNSSYILPTNGIKAGTSTATGQSPNCSVINNSTITAALVCLNIPTIGGTNGKQDVLLYVDGNSSGVDKGDVTLVNLANDALLITTDKISFNPAKKDAVKFGNNDLIMTVNGDNRFTANGATAVCKFKIKNYGFTDTDSVGGYGITQSKLAAVNVGQFVSATNTFDVAYSNNGGCAFRLPAQAQNQPRWEIEIRVVRSDNQAFGTQESYFMLYGAIGVVSITAS